MKTTTWTGLTLSLLLAASGCATDGAGPGDDDDDDDDDVVARTLGDCADDGDPLTEVWSVGNGHGAVGAMAVGGDTVALAGADGSIKTWSLLTEGVEDLVPPMGGGLYGGELEGEAPAFSALGVDPDGTILAGDSLGVVRVYAASGEMMAETSPGEMAITAVVTNPVTGAVAMANDAHAGDLSIWDPGTGELVGPLAILLWGITDLAHDEAGARLVAAGDWYGVAALELHEAGAEPLSWVAQGMELPGDSHELSAVAVTADGTRALAAGRDFLGDAGAGFLLALDLDLLATGETEDPTEVVTDYAELPAGASDLALSPDGTLVAVADASGALHLRPAADLAGGSDTAGAAAAHVAFTADGTRVVTSGADGTLRMFACE